MMKRLIAVMLSIFALANVAHATEAVSFRASDGGTVYGDVYPASGPAAKATLLLFHQAGSNRSEYATIAPRLSGLGYNVLAIDQRAGGNLWGHANQTVTARGGSASFLDALPDLEGALTYATETWHGVPVVAWGSSYSASLVFFLAARHPDQIAGVLSFSPGEYFAGVSVVQQAAKVRCPVFITSAPVPGEIAAAKSLSDAIPGPQNTDFIPRQGVHGSATLREDSNPTGAPQIWSAVDEFLIALNKR
jgi:alpha-beta hydrolase superfamily lysophospholipase